MLPDVDSLSLFVRAAELRSLTKAADASHIGLAAASRRIAALEHRYQTALFERCPRGVELTAAGQTLLAHAKALLTQMNQMEADMGGRQGGRTSVLRLVASTSAMTGPLPKDLATFTEQHPDISLVVEEQWSGEIVDRLVRGDCDIGVIVEGARLDGLDVFPYRSDRLVVVVPAHHELLQYATMTFEDVLEHKLITLVGGSLLVKLLTEQAVLLQKPLRVHVQVRSLDSICRSVEAGLGVGVLPFEVAETLTAGMNLVTIPLREDWALRRMLIGVRADPPYSAPIAAMIQHLSAGSIGTNWSQRAPVADRIAAVDADAVLPPALATRG